MNVIPLIGVLCGTHIETEQSFPQGQVFLLIPIDRVGKNNPAKAQMIQKLYGSVPDVDMPMKR